MYLCALRNVSALSSKTLSIDIITEWLEDDQKHWTKQRHTAKRIHERLRDEHGFTGSYDSVQKFVQRMGVRTKTWTPYRAPKGAKPICIHKTKLALR